MKNQFLPGRRRLASLALFLAVLAATGCGGPKLGSLSGKVTFQGKPLRWGTVVAQFTGGDPRSPNVRSASLADDGSYDIGQIPAGGTVQVYLQIPQLPGNPLAAKPSPEAVKKQKEKAGYEDIPEKYKSAKTSGLSVDVKPGPNHLDINLQS